VRAGWKIRRLGEICTLQRGFDLPKKNRLTGQVPLMGSSGAIDFHNEAKVDGPGVITGRSGSIGGVFYVDNHFWPLNTTLYVKDYHGNYPRFVYYLLSSFDLKRFSSGTGVPTLNRNSVHGETVRVPEAFSEQKRIVAILDEAFAGIETAIANTEKNLANARELFESHADRIVGSLPGDHRCLQDCVEQVSTGPFGSLLHKSDYVSEGLPLVNPINIVDSRIVADDKKRVDEATLDRLSAYVLRKGDVVVARRGEIGRCAVVEPEQHGWLCGTGCFFVRPRQELNPHFLVNLLRSPTGRAELLRRSTGATMKNLGNKALSTFEIRLPSREAQDETIRQLDDLHGAADALSELFWSKLGALQELKQSLLQKAFSGELTADRTEREVETVAT